MKKIKNFKYYGAVLGCIPLLTLSGCGKQYYLEDSMLDKAFIATVDGESLFLKIDSTHKIAGHPELNHDHYRDIISGETLTTTPNCGSSEIRSVNSITHERSLTTVMTADELQKVIDGKLTTEDLMNILDREDRRNQTEQEGQKVRTKTPSKQ